MTWTIMMVKSSTISIKTFITIMIIRVFKILNQLIKTSQSTCFKILGIIKKCFMNKGIFASREPFSDFHIPDDYFVNRRLQLSRGTRFGGDLGTLLRFNEPTKIHVRLTSLLFPIPITFSFCSCRPLRLVPLQLNAIIHAISVQLTSLSFSFKPLTVFFSLHCPLSFLQTRQFSLVPLNFGFEPMLQHCSRSSPLFSCYAITTYPAALVNALLGCLRYFMVQFYCSRDGYGYPVDGILSNFGQAWRFTGHGLQVAWPQ